MSEFGQSVIIGLNQTLALALTETLEHRGYSAVSPTQKAETRRMQDEDPRSLPVLPQLFCGIVMTLRRV